MKDQIESVIIVDLDGVVYDCRARQHLAAAKQWEDFHKSSSTDRPNFDVLRLISAMQNAGTFILAITARSANHRRITEKWLSDWEVPIDELLMREVGDFRSSGAVKTESAEMWMKENGLSKSAFIFALEDRDAVVDAWRGWGIPCYQVRPGGY